MARELKVEIVGDSKSLERALGNSTKGVDQFGGSLTKLGRVAAAAGVAIAVGVGAGAVKAVKAASDLQEQINKSNVVFGKSADEVQKWSRGLEQSFGLSSRAALEAAGTYGNMLVPMGFARDRAAEMSKSMVQLAGDMASFNNASPEETLDAIRAGLAGETEPLRRFGVFLSAARVQSEALTETHKKTAKELTVAEKATAAYNIILKDTKDTQGDFARSAGTSLANQMRILSAQFENVAASLGTVLLPIAIRVMRFISGTLVPGIGRAADAVSDWFNALSTKLSKAPDLNAKIRVSIASINELASSFVDALISQIASLLPQKEVPLNFKLQHRGGETQAGGVDWNAVADDVIAGLTAAIEGSGKLAKSMATSITNAIGQVDWAATGRVMGPGLAAAVVSAFATLLDPAFWVKNWDLALAIAVTVFGGAIGRVAGALAAKLSPALLGVVARVSPAFAAAMGRLMEDAGRVAVAVLGRVGGNLLTLVTNIFGRLGRAAIFIVKVLGVTALIDAIQDLARVVGQKIQEIIDWFSRLPARIQAAFADAGTWLYNAGVAIIQGLWDGLKSKWDAVAGWLAARAGEVRRLKGPPAQDAVLLKDIGQLIMGGLEFGLRDGWDTKVEPFLSGLSEKMRTKMSSVVDAAAQAISDKKGAFAAAFDALAQNALAAFDKLASDFETSAEKRLRKMEENRSAKARKDALDEANKALADAKAKQASLDASQFASPEEFAAAQEAATKAVTDAEKQRADAVYEIQRANLEKRAAQQRKHQDDIDALNRQHFQNQLTQIQTAYSNGKISAEEFHQKIVALFKQYKIPYNKGAEELGLALAEGLNQSFKKVSAAARALAQEVVDQFAKIRVIINVDLSTKGEGGKGGKLPKRQHGGFVKAGQAYLVGEAGPEVFVSGVSGRIDPGTTGTAVGMGGGISLNVNLSGTFFGDKRDEIAESLADSIHEALLRKQRRTGSLGIT